MSVIFSCELATFPINWLKLSSALDGCGGPEPPAGGGRLNFRLQTHFDLTEILEVNFIEYDDTSY